MIPDEAQVVLRDLNPWWVPPHRPRVAPPPFRRRAVQEVRDRLLRPAGLIEVIRGPRQVGKTTGIQQIVEDLIAGGVPPGDILFIRFDDQVLCETPGGLAALVKWFADAVLGRPLGTGRPAYVFLDEVHKLKKWDAQVKHVGDTFPLRILITGSSSVLVARGGRESLAGRVFSTELPTFTFREVLDAWHADRSRTLPPPLRLRDLLDRSRLAVFGQIEGLTGQQKPALKSRLETYFNRGGYPRLHSRDVDEDVWADYLRETILENVLGADIPLLFPVQEPRLLRHLYLSVARQTGQEVSQVKLAALATEAGFATTQPTVGAYLRYLADALLIREFWRYPLIRKRSARTPAKLMVTDLGVRNAIFRGAPSLWESEPGVVGPLVETLVQSVMRDAGTSIHFWRDYEKPNDRTSPVREVDFVVETEDAVLPVEVKFRKRIDPEDYRGLRVFLDRHKDAPHGILVTRDLYEWREDVRVLAVPLLAFLSGMR